MKTIYWETNFNNKLDNKCIMHIDYAPTTPIPESYFPCAVTVCTKDNSHAPILLELQYFIRGLLKDFWFDVFTMPSHGMDREAYLDWLMKQVPSFDDTKELAVYFYKNSCV